MPDILLAAEPVTEPDTLLTVSGLTIIAVTVGLLIWGRVSPIVAMVVIPVLGALLTGFGLDEIQEFFSSGLSSVMNVVVMFIFAIIFFGIMSDAGLFDPLIRGLIVMTRGRVVLVAMGTVLIGAVAHLDGAGATTFLLTIPALLPLYKALNMSRYLLLLLVCLSASLMNMVPWGGPLGRTAAATGIDPVELYQPLLPVQGAGLVLLLVMAAVLGLREVRRIDAGVASGEFVHAGDVDVRQIADEFHTRQLESRADVADKVQELYLDGKKAEAAAAIPLAMVEDVALVGPPAKIRDELDKWRETCITEFLVSGPAMALPSFAELVLG